MFWTICAAPTAPRSSRDERWPLVFVVFAGVVMLGGFIFTQLSAELTPPEDRGNLVIQVQAPEGAGFEYTTRVMRQVKRCC